MKPSTTLLSILGFVLYQSFAQRAAPNRLLDEVRPRNFTRLRVSEQKCIQYNEFANRASLLLRNQQRNRQTNAKLRKNIGPDIVGGIDAKSREFAHMALIGFDGSDGPQWDCGGSLISDIYVLTAGHCLYSRQYGDAKYVRLGDLVLNSAADNAQPVDINISLRIAHPHYHPPSLYNDIALVKLKQFVSFSPYIYPACLHNRRMVNVTTAIATGWGLLNFAGQPSDHLMKVELELFSLEDCNRTYKAEKKLATGINEKSQICAGSSTEEKDTCQGDSGGPLQIFVPHIHHIIGVTSFGKACGFVNVPAVYTRVSYYLKWIESTVWPQ